MENLTNEIIQKKFRENSSLFDFSINEADVMSTYREMDEMKYKSTYNSDLVSDEYVITSNDNKVLYIYH